MSQSTLDQTSNQESSFQPAAPGPTSSRGADPQVCRAGIRADTSSPEAASPQPPQPQIPRTAPTNADGDWSGVDPCVETGSIGTIPQPQLPQTTETAAVDIGGPSPTPERREGVPPPSPALAHFNPERREGVPPPSPASGPKTEAGKSISSRNAVTHGLRAKKIENAVTPALRHQYDTLRRQYLDDYRPSGAIENTLFDMLVFAAWQLYKIRDMELFTDLDLGMPGSFGRSEKLARYRGSHERLFFRSLNQLKQIQQERLLRETDQKAAIPTQIPPGVRLKPLFAHLKSLHRHPKTKRAVSVLSPTATRSGNQPFSKASPTSCPRP